MIWRATHSAVGLVVTLNRPDGYTACELQEVEVMCLNNAEDRVLRVDLTRSISAVTRSMSAVMNHQESAREI